MSARDDGVTGGEVSMAARDDGVTGGEVSVAAHDDGVTGGEVSVVARDDIMTGGEVSVAARDDIVTGGEVSVAARDDAVTGGEVSVTSPDFDRFPDAPSSCCPGSRPSCSSQPSSSMQGSKWLHSGPSFSMQKTSPLLPQHRCCWSGPNEFPLPTSQ